MDPGSVDPGPAPADPGDAARPVSAIRNLGPASDALYARAGLTSAAQVRAMGADAAYLRLLRIGHRPHFIAYYALVLGLEGRPWTDLPAAEKAALRRRFDALKSEAALRNDAPAEDAPPDEATGDDAPRDAAPRTAGAPLCKDPPPMEKGRSRLEAALDIIGVRAAQPTSSRPEKK